MPAPAPTGQITYTYNGVNYVGPAGTPVPPGATNVGSVQPVSHKSLTSGNTGLGAFGGGPNGLTGSAGRIGPVAGATLPSGLAAASAASDPPTTSSYPAPGTPLPEGFGSRVGNTALDVVNSGITNKAGSIFANVAGAAAGAIVPGAGGLVKAGLTGVGAAARAIANGLGRLFGGGDNRASDIAAGAGADPGGLAAGVAALGDNGESWQSNSASSGPGSTGLGGGGGGGAPASTGSSGDTGGNGDFGGETGGDSGGGDAGFSQLGSTNGDLNPDDYAPLDKDH